MTTARRFHERFRGLERAYGTYAVKEREGLKLKGQARTLVGAVTDELWAAHLAGKQSLGVTPINDNATCRWGAIDIDVYEGLDLQALADKIKEHELPLVTCTTKSGGVHLFLFTSEPVDAAVVRDRLSRWAHLLGHPRAEVFPKQVRLASTEDVGSWLNMPYFDAAKTTRHALVDGMPVGPVEFLRLADATAASKGMLVGFAQACDPLLEGAPPCLQFLCREGVQRGSRNLVLFQLGIYARKRWPDEWEDRLRELNDKFLDPPLPTRESEMMIRSVRRKDYGFKCADQPMKGVCNSDLCRQSEYGVASGEDGSPGVELRDLVKYDSRPPMWFLTVQDKRICVSDTRVLLDQRLFSRLCVDEVHVVPDPVKEPRWREIIQGLLEVVEVVEVPGDAQLDGLLFDLVESFCVDSPCGQEIGDLMNGAVFRDADTWYFRSRDLLRFLDTHKFPEKDPSKLWAKLKSLGGEAGSTTSSGKTIRYWCLPAGRFTEEHGTRASRVNRREF